MFRNKEVVEKMTLEKEYFTEFKEAICRYYPVSDESFLLFKNIAKFQTLKANEILLPIGKISRHIHYICKGAIIAFFTDSQGNTYNKNIFLEGRFAISTVSALLKSPSEFTLQAIEETTLLSLDYQQYKGLIYANDELKNFYIAYLEQNWIIEKERREISIVMENASIRYQKLLQEYPEIDRRVPLQHIASNLGITPTQLSRIRKLLKKK